MVVQVTQHLVDALVATALDANRRKANRGGVVQDLVYDRLVEPNVLVCYLLEVKLLRKAGRFGELLHQPRDLQNLGAKEPDRPHDQVVIVLPTLISVRGVRCERGPKGQHPVALFLRQLSTPTLDLRACDE